MLHQSITCSAKYSSMKIGYFHGEITPNNDFTSNTARFKVLNKACPQGLFSVRENTSDEKLVRNSTSQSCATLIKTHIPLRRITQKLLMVSSISFLKMSNVEYFREGCLESLIFTPNILTKSSVIYW